MYISQKIEWRPMDGFWEICLVSLFQVKSAPLFKYCLKYHFLQKKLWRWEVFKSRSLVHIWLRYALVHQIHSTIVSAIVYKEQRNWSYFHFVKLANWIMLRARQPCRQLNSQWLRATPCAIWALLWQENVASSSEFVMWRKRLYKSPGIWSVEPVMFVIEQLQVSVVQAWI